MNVPPPINSDQEPEDDYAPRSWRDLTIGEVLDRASRAGMAILSGIKAAKEAITEPKDER